MNEEKRTRRLRKEFKNKPEYLAVPKAPKKKHEQTYTWLVLVYLGAVATVLGIIASILDGRPVLVGIGLLLVLIGAVVRLIEKILAVLIDINDKLESRQSY